MNHRGCVSAEPKARVCVRAESSGSVLSGVFLVGGFFFLLR